MLSVYVYIYIYTRIYIYDIYIYIWSPPRYIGKEGLNTPQGDFEASSGKAEGNGETP